MPPSPLAGLAADLAITRDSKRSLASFHHFFPSLLFHYITHSLTLQTRRWDLRRRRRRLTFSLPDSRVVCV